MINGINTISGKIVFLESSVLYPMHFIFPSLSKNKFGWIANNKVIINIYINSVIIFLESILYLLF